MKILFVTYFYEQDFGGAELIMRTLRQCLQEKGHAVDILCLAGGTQPQPGTVWRIPLPALLIRHPHQTKRAFIFLNSVLFDRLLLRGLRRLELNAESYDLIHCQDIHSLKIGVHLARTHRKILGLTLQDNVPREFLAGITNPIATLLLRTTLRLRDRRLRPCLRQCHWIATASRHVGQKLTRFLAPGGPPVHTIYSPRPMDVDPPSHPNPPNPEPHLLFLGRLSREKGVDVLVEAFQRLDRCAQLNFLGLIGPLKPLVEAASRRDARIRLLPPVPHREVHDYIRRHDVICSPSLWNDPLPGTVIEARVHQKSILTTDRGGIPEILEHYARSTIVATEGKPREQLVQAVLDGLTRAIDHIATPLDSGHEQCFLDLFSARHFTAAYEALYQKGLQEG